MRVINLNLKDLAELEPAENMTDVNLCWIRGDSIENVFLMLRSWRHLRRLTVVHRRGAAPPFEVLTDFIMGMKYLSYLEFDPNYDRFNYGELELLRDKVNELILPRRPEFKLDICSNTYW
jgi:hypothetical protein